MNRSEQIEALIEAHRQIVRALYSAAVPHWLGLDLSMAQMKVILVLADRPPLTISEVGTHLGVSQSTASILVDRLVQAELVTRKVDADDRRRALVSLSLAGSEMITRLRHGGHDLLTGWIQEAELDDEDLVRISDGLQAIAQFAIAAQELRREPERASGLLTG